MSELPPGWEWSTLGEICLKPQYGWTTKSDLDSSGLLYLRTTDITKGAIEWARVPRCQEDPANPASFLLDDGDIVVSRAGSVGASALLQAPPPAVFASYLIRLRAVPPIVPSYLRHFLQSSAYWQQISDAKVGIAVQNVNATKLAAISLPVPPAAEQARIVAAVEEHLSRLDAAQASVRSAQARIHAFDRTVLGLAQAQGDEMPLDELLVDIEAGRSFKTPGRRARPDEWGVIKVSAMTWGEFDEDENKAVPASQAIDGRYEIRPGDLLLSRANTSDYVGATVLVGKCRPRLLLSDKSMRLLTKESVHRQWLRFALGSPAVRSQMSLQATGTSDSMRNISQAKVRGLKIRVPGPEQQAAIADEIGLALRSRTRLEIDVEVARTRAAALRRSILTAAFSGQLVPQDPDDEPASVLLERIRAERATAAPMKRTRKAKAS